MGLPAGPAGALDGVADPTCLSAAPLRGHTLINAANDVEFVEPIVEGDLLAVVEELVSVSPEKTTRLGVGHFVQTLETYRRQDGTVVAVNRNTLFRFSPTEVTP